MRNLIIILSLFLCSCTAEDIYEMTTNGDKLEDTELDLSYAPACYPTFSWDKVPLNAHFSKDTGNFTDEEAEFIANTYQFISLEKNQGESGVGVDIEAPEDAVLIKKYNSNCKVLYYFNTRNDYTDLWSTGAIMTYNPSDYPTVTDENSKNYDWIFHIGDTFYNDATTYRHRYDPRNDEMKEWWATEAKNMVNNNSALDGIFADGMMTYVEGYSVSSVKKALDTESSGSHLDYMQGCFDMLTDVMNDFNNQKMILGNCLRSQRYPESDAAGNEGFLGLDYVHGGMMEHFCAPQSSSYTKEFILSDIETIERACALGKLIVVKGWPRYWWINTELDAMSDAEKEEMLREDITFPLACYLLGAGEYSYFSYSWGYRMEHGWMLDYEEFNKPLGAPQGAKVKVYPSDDSSYEYTRLFEHAHVWVDIANFEAKITWF